MVHCFPLDTTVTEPPDERAVQLDMRTSANGPYSKADKCEQLGKSAKSEANHSTFYFWRGFPSLFVVSDYLLKLSFVLI